MDNGARKTYSQTKTQKRTTSNKRPLADLKDSSRNYQYSSLAHSLDTYEYKEKTKVIKTRKKPITRKQRILQIKNRKKPIYKIISETHKKIKLSEVFLFVALFGFAFIYLNSFSKVLNVEAQNARLENSLAQIKQENNALESSVIESFDLVAIEETATKKLGMRKPQEHEIIPITPTSRNYMSLYEESKTESNDFNLQNLLGIVR